MTIINFNFTFTTGFCSVQTSVEVEVTKSVTKTDPSRPPNNHVNMRKIGDKQQDFFLVMIVLNNNKIVNYQSKR